MTQVHALGLLRFILTHLSHNGVVVTLQQAIDVEARCLDALDWRLGPFFVEDELTGGTGRDQGARRQGGDRG